MTWKQRIWGACFFTLVSPYLLYSLIIQLVVYKIAVLLFNLDIKMQSLMIVPYNYVLNKLESKSLKNN